MPIVLDANKTPLVVMEKTSCQLTATLKDETGAAIAVAALSTLTLTLYNRDSAGLDIINSVTAVTILNTGRGVVHATSGLLTLTLLPADNPIMDATKDYEWHRALIEWTYSGGAKAGKDELDFQVRNINKVS